MIPRFDPYDPFDLEVRARDAGTLKFSELVRLRRLRRRWSKIIVPDVGRFSPYHIYGWWEEE